MQYLLDTDTLSSIMRRDQPALLRFRSSQPDLIAVSVVTIMEIQFGFERKPAYRQKLQPVYEQILAVITTLNYTNAEALHTARIRAHLESIGKRTGSYDAQLAGTAVAHNLVFVTNNTANFDHVPGLVLENWVKP
jgi:tRNA(fMet)-specific endonuclease VapC